MKKIYIMMMLVLAGTMAMAQTSVWDGSRAVWTQGSGTENDPYLIESAQNLACLAYMVNKDFDTEGMYFKLTTDIDLNGSEDQPWIPIGTVSYYDEDGCDRGSRGNTSFRGHFDGGDHFIYNIYVEHRKYAGLFGKTFANPGQKVIIENVFLASGSITGQTCGGIVGEGQGLDIYRCWNNATITGTDVGGIVGNNVSQVINCKNTGDVTGETCAGGIVGNRATTVEECYNTGNVECESAQAKAGGIAGWSWNVMYINNCYNAGAVSSSGGEEVFTPAAGGLIGYTPWSIAINNSFNIGEVTSTNIAGCLVGFYPNMPSLENCFYLNTCTQSEIGTSLDEEYMRSQEFVDVLNNGNRDEVWGLDVNNNNNGFPILVNNDLDVSESHENGFKIYPNPSQGQFIVEGTGTVIVRNLMGQTLLTRVIEGQALIHLPQGFYFVTIGHTTQKIIVE